MFNLMICTFVFAFITKSSAKECQNLENHQNYKLLNPKNCGRSEIIDQSISTRIMGSNKTAIGTYPWMAIVSVTKDLEDGSTTNRECDGTLINDKYVLTAGTCLSEEGENTRVKVWLRVYQEDRLDIINCDLRRCSPPPLEVEVESFVIHPDPDYDNLALIRFQDKIKFDEFMKPICLPLSCVLSTQDYLTFKVIMLGFDTNGVERTGLDFSALEEAQLRVIGPNPCQDMWGEDHFLQRTEICAALPGGRSAACSKDVGGPLMTKANREGLDLSGDQLAMYQIGIVSTVMCDNFTKLSKPNLFTRVGSYIPFILDHIKP